MTVLAIIVAAGRGVRMGAGRPKAFLRLRGLTLLERSIGVFVSPPGVERVVAAVPGPGEAARVLGPPHGKVVLVPGGATRQDSVGAGLQALTPGTDEIILVHDAARPLVSRQVIDTVIAAAAGYGAAVPVIPPTDTIKQVAPDGVIEATLPRGRLWLAQTPQGFRGPVLRGAYARATRDGFLGTDDAALVERTGHRVHMVEGAPRNLKITSPLDLALAEAILAQDMGARFPDSDETLRGRPSLWFLEEVMREARTRGFEIVNVDTVILAEAPRLQPHIAAMRKMLAAALGVSVDSVTVKAKRLEGMGAVGRQEGIMAQAIALLAGPTR